MIVFGFPRSATIGIASSCVLALTGCGGGLGEIGSSAGAGYTRSSALIISGYSETASDETHYEVRANGTTNTAKARVEKIALTRAAEIGVENKFRFFKVTNIRHGVVCGKKTEIYKGGTQAALHYPTVRMDVEYARGNAPPDASYLVAADSFERTSSELNGEIGNPEDRAATSADVKSQCGAG